jgi:hypothetical protein
MTRGAGANVLVWTASHPNGLVTLRRQARMRGERPVNIPVRIGMDTSKSVFQLHGVDENEVVVVLRPWFQRAPR